MGYQLFLLKLCVTVPALVTPTNGLLVPAPVIMKSVRPSGGSGLLHLVQTPPALWKVQTGAIPAVSIDPSPLRSPGSCRTRMAFGWIELPPGMLGGRNPRANPRPSHSFVTPTQTPRAFLYSTRR